MSKIMQNLRTTVLTDEPDGEGVHHVLQVHQHLADLRRDYRIAEGLACYSHDICYVIAKLSKGCLRKVR